MDNKQDDLILGMTREELADLRKRTQEKCDAIWKEKAKIRNAERAALYDENGKYIGPEEETDGSETTGEISFEAVADAIQSKIDKIVLDAQKKLDELNGK